MIEFVFFDADGTLFDLDTALRRALRTTLRELRRLLPTPASHALTIETLQAARDQVAAELRGLEYDLERIRLAGFARTLQRCGSSDPALAERLTAYFLHHRFTGIQPYADVPAALAELGRSYRLGVLSNGNSHPDRCGLPGRFETVVLAQDHGVEKPDRRLYEIAAAEVGARPEQLVMVGDSIDDDVLGARRAGWHAIWLNRTASRWPASHPPAAAIATLSEMPAALTRLARGESA